MSRPAAPQPGGRPATRRSESGGLAGVGAYFWGGAFGTSFWIDPKNELIGVFMIQSFPPDFTMATAFKKLTYEAMK